MAHAMRQTREVPKGGGGYGLPDEVVEEQVGVGREEDDQRQVDPARHVRRVGCAQVRQREQPCKSRSDEVRLGEVA